MKFLIGAAIVAVNAGIVVPSLTRSWHTIAPAHGSPHTAPLAAYAITLLISLAVLGWLARSPGSKKEAGPAPRSRYGSFPGGR